MQEFMTLDYRDPFADETLSCSMGNAGVIPSSPTDLPAEPTKKEPGLKEWP
jgi:hypothetical protein